MNHTWRYLAAVSVLFLSPAAHSQTPKGGTDIPRPSSGVPVGPPSEQFGMRIGARVQARYNFENKETESAHQFQIRRARVKVKGHIFGKNNRFYIQLGFSPQDMTGGVVSEDGSPRRVPLRDARIQFDQLWWANIWLGQMKVPFSRERIISDANLDMIDRSLLNHEFNMDRDIGVQVRAEDVGGFFGYAVGVFSGQGRNIYDASEVAFSFVGRLQFHIGGELDESTEGDLQRSAHPAAGFGVAYSNHTHAPGDQGVHGSRPEDGGTTDIEETTADFVFKWQGWALEAALMARRGFRRIGVQAVLPEPARNGYGGMAQLGFLIPGSHWEVVGRASTLRPLSFNGIPSSLEEATEVNSGVNYYIGGHDLKLELDAGHLWERAPQSSTGVAQERGVTTVRLQVQMAI